jgi:Rrf2 family protein
LLKLNRTTEYGLIALKHMSRKRLEVTSAREVADHYGLPFEITAKTLLRLKDSGLIQSAQGARGGYTILKDLDSVTLAEFLEQMEGPLGVVACATEQPAPTEGHCEYHGKCELKSVMSGLNAKLVGFLSGIRLSELTGEQPARQKIYSIDPVEQRVMQS